VCIEATAVVQTLFHPSLSVAVPFTPTMDIPGRPKNRDHFVLRFVTLEILIRSASNLAQIKVISFHYIDILTDRWHT